MKTFNFFIFVFLGSCSFLIQRIDSPLIRREDYINNIPSQETYCSTERPTNFQLIGTNKQIQDKFLAFFETRKDLDFIDQLILWNLAQFNINPHQTSPESRFQILIDTSNEELYLDFFSEEETDQYPFLYALDWILKKYKKSKSLEYYASLLQSHGLTKTDISQDFAQFLNTHKNEIEKNETLKNLYFRGNEILTENESFPELRPEDLIKIYRQKQKEQKITIKSSLYSFITEDDSRGECNYDFNLYNNSIFLIDKTIPSSTIYGLQNSKDVFLASSSLQIDKIASLKQTPLFKGNSKARSAAICRINTNSNLIWAISNKSRDPGQHLFHLIRYGLSQTQNVQDVDKLIRQSRYIFLSEPVRLIFESNRGNPNQIENLLKLNVPLYSSDSLGNIWSYTKFKDDSRFVRDDRNAGEISCR